MTSEYLPVTELFKVGILDDTATGERFYLSLIVFFTFVVVSGCNDRCLDR